MIFIIGKNDTVKSETNFGRSIFGSVSLIPKSAVMGLYFHRKLGIKICRTTSQWGPYITVMNDGVLRALLIKSFDLSGLGPAFFVLSFNQFLNLFNPYPKNDSI